MNTQSNKNFSILLLLAGTLLVGFSAGRWLFPLAAWIGPALIMRYARDHKGWRGIPLVFVAYILAFIDREIIAMLVPDIRHDLGISDTQISFLLGGAFAVFYTFFGIALAWLADSSNRRWIIFGGIAVWSLMTAACGMAI